MSELIDRDKKVVWHPFSKMKGDYPIIPLKAAKEEFLITEDGTEIIDGISSWWVNIHGHSNPELAQAIFEQALKLEHVIFAGFTHEPAVKLSESLCEILPNNSKKVFYSDNGSTAIEVALKIAMQFYFNKGIKKSKIIALAGAYHGDTFGAMSVGDRGGFTTPFHPYFFDVEFITFPINEEDEKKSLIELAEIIKQNESCIFIYEPLVQGAGGMRIYRNEWLQKALEVSNKPNCIRIADEVFTGFGRTGKLFASEYCHQQADIICLSKGITGGILPLGATACNQRIIDAFDSGDWNEAFLHGHSFTGNPIIMAAANKSLEILLRDTTLHAIASIKLEQAQFAEKIKKHPQLTNVKSLGTILSLEVKTQSNSGYFNSMRENIYNYFLAKNILLRPLGNTIYFLPPYIISSKSLRKVHNAISDFIDSL
jgi:adenosylmethionine-8-amino-7-oxononanoate aminotransferase